MYIILGILIPFLGTTLGSSMVFFMKNNLNKKIENILLGFASGVMIAAAIWSLIIPSIEMAEVKGDIPWIPAAFGLILGVLSLIATDLIIDKIKNIKKGNMLALAVTIHNIPEGMAIGVIFSGILSNTLDISLAEALILSLGIGIQNFPEGAIISMPLKCKKMTKMKSFIFGTLSGVVEPISAIITILLTDFIVPVLPYLLAFAAGAMIFVVVEELIPESQKGNFSYISTVGVVLGFVVMMILDVALG